MAGSDRGSSALLRNAAIASPPKRKEIEAMLGRKTGRRLMMGVATTLMLGAVPAAIAQQATNKAPAEDPQDATARKLLSRLDLEKYKATIKGLTQFGDRRQGTDRNRKAVDWIEAQLQSYGCPTERVKYVFDPPPRPAGAASPRPEEPFQPVIGSGEVRQGPGGAR